VCSSDLLAGLFVFVAMIFVLWWFVRDFDAALPCFLCGLFIVFEFIPSLKFITALFSGFIVAFALLRIVL
jgi:hypothetical protein